MNVSSPVPNRLALAAGAVAIAVALAGFVLGVGNKPEGTVGQPATVSDTDPASAALPPSLELSGAFAWRDGDKLSVYFSITNTGGRDVLKAATSDVAEEGRLVGEVGARTTPNLVPPRTRFRCFRAIGRFSSQAAVG